MGIKEEKFHPPPPGASANEKKRHAKGFSVAYSQKV